MPQYWITIRHRDGSERRTGTSMATLEEAAKSAFEVADDLSTDSSTDNNHVRCVDLYEEHSLLLSIQIIAGVALDGTVHDRRSE